MHIEEHLKESVGKEDIAQEILRFDLGFKKINKNLLADKMKKGILDRSDNNVNILRIK